MTRLHKSFPVLLSLLSVIGFGGCDRAGRVSQNPILGDYQITAHDKSGNLAFSGTVSLESLEQDHLVGSCLIKRESGAPDGILDQQSRCEAIVEGKRVELDLAPMMDDAGLLLEGEFEEGRISGVWRLDGFVTSDVLGRFQAVKKTWPPRSD